MADELQDIGLERGWGDTVGSTLDTMHLLGELLQVSGGGRGILTAAVCSHDSGAVHGMSIISEVV